MRVYRCLPLTGSQYTYRRPLPTRLMKKSRLQTHIYPRDLVKISVVNYNLYIDCIVPITPRNLLLKLTITKKMADVHFTECLPECTAVGNRLKSEWTYLKDRYKAGG